jgi:hypothetical protein
VACAVAAIKGLGLEASPEKSEAMWFCRKADYGTPPADYRLRLVGAEIGIGISMRYLGLTLDSHWTFGVHVERLIPSVAATANALGRLLSRLGGPGIGVRRLYAGVVRAKFLYGSPIWAEDLVTNSRNLRAIRRLHRAVAIRIRGFRTISVAVLAGLPSFELQALRCCEIYLRIRGLLGGVGEVDADAEARDRREQLDIWRAGFDTITGTPGLRVLGAVLPNWRFWSVGARHYHAALPPRRGGCPCGFPPRGKKEERY